MTPHDFLDAKMALFSRWPGRETSGQRSPTAQHALDPATPHGPHQFWVGTDYILDTWGPVGHEAPVKVPDFEEDARRVGLFANFEQDHYHLQPLTWEKG